MSVLEIVIVIALLLGLVLILAYNRLVQARNRVDNAWSQITVQLERRHDLVPNLVRTVKGYAVHERQTFEAVAEARVRAMGAQGPPAKAESENLLSDSLKSLLAVAEAYPALRASEEFLNLQQQLSDTESRIAFARQFYNDAVFAYNTATQVLPRRIVATMFGFTPRPFFDVETTDRAAVPVEF